MKKLRIGHIGTKHDHSGGKLDCICKYPDLFEIVGIAEEDPVQYEAVKDHPVYRDVPFLSVEQLLNAGCDCMMIEGFEYDIPYYAELCVKNGIAVHADKPAGRDLDVFRNVLKTAKAKNVPVQMAYMYRYNPAVLECMDYINSGKLGEIHSVTAIMNTGHSKEKRTWLKNFDAGNMFFLGCHMVDLVYRIQGTPDRITPYLKSSGFDGVDALDMGTVVFDYKRGTSIIQANACEINGYGRRQLVVCGDKGTYEIRPLEKPIGAIYTAGDSAEPFEDRHTVRSFVTVPSSERYDTMMLDFAAMVRGEKENPYSYEYELQLQKLVLASCGYHVDYRTQEVL